MAVRLPEELRAAARVRASNTDMTFSQLMRRAMRRELGLEACDCGKRIKCDR